MDMTRSHAFLLLSLFGILALPMRAQTQIGGGTCNSSSLDGAYSFTLTGRQLTATGTFPNVLQANGSITFGGESKVAMTMTANTNQGLATPVSWSGTYSVQANCAGVVNVTTGNTTALTLAVYNQGHGFLITGTDATYSYTGGGNTQPATCMASLLSDVYTFNSTGYTLSGSAVNGFGDAAGLLQFDGQSNVVANFTLSSGGGQTASAIALTGTYSVGSTCLGSATLTDSKSNSYTMTISISNSNKVSTAGFDLLLAQASKLIMSGAGHAAYGQPVASAALRRPVGALPAGRSPQPLLEAAYRGE